MNYTTDNFHYDSEYKTFVAEASELNLSPYWWNSFRDVPVTKAVTLYNPKTQNSKRFEYVKTDTYGSPEEMEVGGWNYVSDDGIKLLIIND